MGLNICSSWTYQELADACNADSDDMEMKFMSILCTRSYPHLRKGKGQRSRRQIDHSDQWITNLNVCVSLSSSWSLSLLFTVFQEFVRCSNKDIEQIIKKEMSGDVKNAFYGIGNNCLWPYLTHSVYCWHNTCSVTPPQPLLALSLLHSSQCEEPALLFCRPSVQSHEGIYS